MILETSCVKVKTLNYTKFFKGYEVFKSKTNFIGETSGQSLQLLSKNSKELLIYSQVITHNYQWTMINTTNEKIKAEVKNFIDVSFENNDYSVTIGHS